MIDSCGLAIAGKTTAILPNKPCSGDSSVFMIVSLYTNNSNTLRLAVQILIPH